MFCFHYPPLSFITLATPIDQQIRNSAQQTIQIEAEAIQQLAQFIDYDFVTATQTIYQCKGRLVVTGIGKSAIIAQKIVATLNSTGTPALFMHAADAIHGDLGMITPADVVLCISKSGETPEIKVLAPLVKNLGSCLIAMVGNTASYLANQAQLVLNTTVLREACPNNLAPTSSTTAQLVMGDALAVALLELRGFSPSDFARFHPGGALGKQLYLKVSDIYTQNASPAVLLSTPLSKVIVEMTTKLLGSTAVVDANNKLLGIITDGDLRRALMHNSNLNNLTAANLMTPNPKTLLPQTLAITAWETLRQHKITQIVVADEQNNYLGIVHIHNLAREGFI